MDVRANTTWRKTGFAGVNVLVVDRESGKARLEIVFDYLLVSKMEVEMPVVYRYVTLEEYRKRTKGGNA